jgi:hypothetical protein
LGNAKINASSRINTVAVGNHLSEWSTDNKGMPSRVIINSTITWELPQPNLCLFSTYSGKAIEIDGMWLKTAVLQDNCTKPSKGWGVLGGNANIHLFSSTDRLRWKWRSLVCAGNVTGGEEGADENDMVLDASGALLVIFRVDGGDGYPAHDHKPFQMSRSKDAGLTWTAPLSIPPTPDGRMVGSARPQMLMLTPTGPLLLTGGRPFLMLWVSGRHRV